MPHNLSHSHSQLLEFQINPLSHILLSTNILHSHLHFSLFKPGLSLPTLGISLHLHQQVLYRPMFPYVSCFISS